MVQSFGDLFPYNYVHVLYIDTTMIKLEFTVRIDLELAPTNRYYF